MRKSLLVLSFLAAVSLFGFAQNDPFSGTWVCTGSWAGGNSLQQDVGSTLTIQKVSDGWKLHSTASSNIQNEGIDTFHGAGNNMLRDEYQMTLDDAHHQFPNMPDKILRQALSQLLSVTGVTVSGDGTSLELVENALNIHTNPARTQFHYVESMPGYFRMTFRRAAPPPTVLPPVVVPPPVTKESSSCNDDLCRGFVTVLNAAPDSFAAVQGPSRGNRQWEGSVKLIALPADPYTSFCVVGGGNGNPFTYVCFESGTAAQMQAAFDHLKAAALKAAPGACWKQATEYRGDTQLEMSTADECNQYLTSHAILRISTAPPSTDGMSSLTLSFPCCGSRDLAQQLQHPSVLTFKELPPNARVALSGLEVKPLRTGSETMGGSFLESRSGNADESGNLVLPDLRWGRYTVHITAFGHRPFDQEIMLDGQPQTMSPHMEPGPLGLNEVVDALKKNVPPARIKGFVTELGVDFPLNDDTEKKLRDAGADSDLLVVIAKNKK